MKQERIIIGGLFLLQVVLWLGFIVHRAPRFAGSLPGGVLAISAALLLILPPLFYSAVKRIKFFKDKISKHISLGTLLSWHVYTSIIGSILAVLHTGHRFESNLGVWLTSIMLLTVLSGLIGRYFMSFSSTELSEKKSNLNLLATQYNQMVGESAQQETKLDYPVSQVRRAFNSFVGIENSRLLANAPLEVRALRLAESIADVEYSIKTHELLKKRTRYWLYAHITTSFAFYLLLGIHIWSGIYFGLRFFK